MGYLFVSGALICGGLGGIMEGAAKGAKEGGGVSIGILPGNDQSDANPYIDIPIVTDLGHARNIIIAQTSFCAIAISGEFGTLSEISIALKLGKPVIGLNSWKQIKEIKQVKTPLEVLNEIRRLVN